VNSNRATVARSGKCCLSVSHVSASLGCALAYIRNR
jgi:hypothetical protein